ncbi:MAG: protein kinase domain-containing protein [Gemmatimonadales bacterium]
MNQCSRCHTPLPVDGRFCSHCGTPSGELAHVCPPDPTNDLKERLARTLAGRYEILRLLGRGGMAVVFLAQDLVLEREVAIKVLPPEMSHDTKLISRFQQEAKTAARLDHPNIIPIYRVESEAGLNYFVMKFVNGRTLEQVLESGPLPVAQARRVLREAALALGHAHQRKIVHRDVKPANIMVEADGRVVLTDFGISKAAQGGSGLTGTGAIIGTPHYMAPEQAKGLEVDGRADQYALAIVGHHILTGKLPFDGSAHSILYKHVFEPPPPMLEVRPDTPKDLSLALARALSKDPAERFPSMEEFAAAVSGDRRSGAATVVSVPVKTTKESQPLQAKLRFRMTRRSVLSTLAVCVLALAGSAWYGFHRLASDQTLVPAGDQAAGTGSPIGPADSASIAAAIESPKRPAKKEYAMLTVGSEPWGTLYIDNIEIGPTPIADWRLSQGTHRLRIEQEGYQTKIETIVVTGPNPIRRRYSLEAQ